MINLKIYDVTSISKLVGKWYKFHKNDQNNIKLKMSKVNVPQAQISNAQRMQELNVPAYK